MPTFEKYIFIYILNIYLILNSSGQNPTYTLHQTKADDFVECGNSPILLVFSYY